MKDIDTLFSEKLRHHEVTPPPAAWEALGAELQQKRSKRRVGYWSAAAVLLLVGVIAILMVRSNQELEREKPITQNPSSTLRPIATDERLRSNEPDADGETHGTAAPPVVSTDASAPGDERYPIASEPVVVEPRVPEEIPITTPASLAETAVEEVIPENRTQTSSNPTLVVDASRYRKTNNSAELEAEPDRPAEVTVIYQPNPTTLAKGNSIGHRIGKTLTFIQDHRVGFSELRSAKSNLIDKIFSREEENGDAAESTH